jgi:hypothetical protein
MSEYVVYLPSLVYVAFHLLSSCALTFTPSRVRAFEGHYTRLPISCTRLPLIFRVAYAYTRWRHAYDYGCLQEAGDIIVVVTVTTRPLSNASKHINRKSFETGHI